MTGKVFIFLALVACAGCRKKEQAVLKEETTANSPVASSGVAQQDAQMEAQFLPSPRSRPANSIQDRLEGSVHAQLTAQLRMFKALKGRMPENFYEFANTVGDSVPRLPDGMKFVIDPADQTVKAVKK